LKYKVQIVSAAEKEMDKLSTLTHARISRRILLLEDNPRPRSAKKLRGQEEYRIRVGDYRVLYTIDDHSYLVTIFAVGHRREVYR
jgi:mRNA interferase RelE/StbE